MEKCCGVHQGNSFFLSEDLMLSPLHSSSLTERTELKHHMVWHKASHDTEGRHCDVVNEGYLIEALQGCC